MHFVVYSHGYNYGTIMFVVPYIMFVGLDVIGNKITEINITSPTCVREIEGHYNINIMAMLFDAIEKRLASN